MVVLGSRKFFAPNLAEVGPPEGGPSNQWVFFASEDGGISCERFQDDVWREGEARGESTFEGGIFTGPAHLIEEDSEELVGPGSLVFGVTDDGNGSLGLEGLRVWDVDGEVVHEYAPAGGAVTSPPVYRDGFLWFLEWVPSATALALPGFSIALRRTGADFSDPTTVVTFTNTGARRQLRVFGLRPLVGDLMFLTRFPDVNLESAACHDWSRGYFGAGDPVEFTDEFDGTHGSDIDPDEPGAPDMPNPFPVCLDPDSNGVFYALQPKGSWTEQRFLFYQQTSAGGSPRWPDTSQDGWDIGEPSSLSIRDGVGQVWSAGSLVAVRDDLTTPSVPPDVSFSILTGPDGFAPVAVYYRGEGLA